MNLAISAPPTNRIPQLIIGLIKKEGTRFPEILSKQPHVAYKVDDLEKYIADADSVICGPMAANDKGDRLSFVWKDGAILELYQEA